MKFFGVYPLPWWGLQTSATFQSLPGPQILASYTASSADARPTLGRPLSSGTATVALIPPGTMYGERANELDLSVKQVSRFGMYRVSLTVEMFNLLNSSDVLNQKQHLRSGLVEAREHPGGPVGEVRIAVRLLIANCQLLI